jgi:hypothetical protein
MTRSIFGVLIVAGIVLVTMGVIASDSVASDFSRLFTGEPTDRTIWLLITGVVALLVGAFGMTRSPK